MTTTACGELIKGPNTVLQNRAQFLAGTSSTTCCKDRWMRHYGASYPTACQRPPTRHVDGYPRGEGEQLVDGQGVQGFVAAALGVPQVRRAQGIRASCSNGCCALTTGSASYTLTAANPGCPWRSAATRSPSAIIGARLVLTSSAVGCMRARSSAVMMPRVSRLPGRCRLSTSACSTLHGWRRPQSPRPWPGCRALAAPAHNVHTKRLPHARHGSADMAEGIDAEGAPEQARADRRMPMAVFECFTS